MLAINRQPSKATRGKNSIFVVGEIIIIGAVLLFAHLMWYVALEENMELVKIIAITEVGCIVETLDGFIVNIGDCQAQSGRYIDAPIDQKTKERAALMNPTN
jgi:hypothetical protein